MLQNLPAIDLSPRALDVRAFLYDYWCTHGRGPNLRTVHEALGLDRRRILVAYRELQHGLILVMDPRSPHGNLLKLQPFSSYPTQVEVHVDGAFHSYAGCAMESVAVSRMPPFAGRTVRLETFCACCLAPMAFDACDGALTPVGIADPDAVGVHVSASPYEWGNPDIVGMCDSMNWVLGPDHAQAWEHQIARRGILLSIPQASEFVKATADSRMWHHDWPATQMNPNVILRFFQHLGVDTTNWEPPA